MCRRCRGIYRRGLSGANALATVSTTNNADGTTRTVVVRDLTAMTGTNARFIRLEITRP